MGGPNNHHKYFLAIETFESKNSQCFSPFGDLFTPKPFDMPKCFALITATAYANSDEPLFMFLMGRKTCEIISFDEPINDVNKEIFKEVLPFEVKEDESLEKVLSTFIFKIRHIVNNNLKLCLDHE